MGISERTLYREIKRGVVKDLLKRDLTFYSEYSTEYSQRKYDKKQKRKQAPVTESNPSSKPKDIEVRTEKEIDITTSYQQHLKSLITDNNSDIESSQKKIEELHTLIDTKNKDNKKLQSIYDAISELH